MFVTWKAPFAIVLQWEVPPFETRFVSESSLFTTLFLLEKRFITDFFSGLEFGKYMKCGLKLEIPLSPFHNAHVCSPRDCPVENHTRWSISPWFSVSWSPHFCQESWNRWINNPSNSRSLGEVLYWLHFNKHCSGSQQTLSEAEWLRGSNFRFHYFYEWFRIMFCFSWWRRLWEIRFLRNQLSWNFQTDRTFFSDPHKNGSSDNLIRGDPPTLPPP